MKNLLFLFFIISGSITRTWSQNIIKHYTADDGLVSNNVYCALSDQNGYLWFGTDKGVSKFDGAHFENYSIDEGLTDNEVLKLFEDSEGRIWFLTYNGIACFYFRGEIYNPNKYASLKQFTSASFFTHCYETYDRKIYFFKEFSNEFYVASDIGVSRRITSDSSIFMSLISSPTLKGFITLKRLDNKKLQYSLWDFKDYSSPRKTIITENKYLKFTSLNNQIWGLQQSNFKENNYYWVQADDFEKLNQDSLQHSSDFNFFSLIDVTQINDDLITVTDDGLIWLNSDLNTTTSILKNEYTTSIIKDFSGSFWVGTRFGGVYQLSDKTNYSNVFIGDPIYQINQNPFDKNEIWCIGDAGIYVMVENDSIRHYSTRNFFGNENPSDLAFLGKSELLIGSGKGLLYFKDGNFKKLASKSGIKQIWIRDDSIFIARSSELTVQTYDELFKPLDFLNPPYSVLHAGRTICLAITKNNELIAGDNQGSYRIDLTDGSLSRIDAISSRVKKIISQDDITVFGSDVDGIFIRFQNQFIHLNTETGLISNAVNNLTFGANTDAWVATDKGLSKINISEKTIRNFNESDGIPDVRINDVFCKDSNNLLLATSSGLFWFKPTGVSTAVSPKLYIKSVKINERKLELKSVYDLNHTENNIEIELIGIAFNDNLKYYYSLNSDSTNLQPLSGRTLNFVNLSHGEHFVELRCKNKVGDWSNAIQLKFSIKPPFYETSFFWLIVLTIIFVLILYILYSSQSRKNRKRQIELILSETRQKAMQAQLNPHFVFNALNSIQYLFMSGKQDEAHAYLSDFSVLLRNILKHTDKSFISLNEELNNLNLYIELERKRKENNFEFELKINDSIDIYLLQIPVMMLQPFVENALWHGINSHAQIGRLQIEISSISNNRIEIIIADNGTGFSLDQLEKVNSKGIKLIKERINAMNKISPGQIEFRIESDSNGTIVKFIFQEKY